MVQKQPPEVFCKKKDFLRNFANFTKKRLHWSLLLLKLQAPGLQLYEKGTPTQMFSCEICDILKNSYFVEHLRAAASDGSESDENDDESYNKGTEAVVRSPMFFIIEILKNFANFTGKHLCWSFFVINFIKTDYKN